MKKFPNKAFTLIELVVSLTILAVIFVSVFTIYTNLIAINKRLQIIRIVQENTRSITEEIASDIREKGIDLAYYDGSASDKKTDYTARGTRVLAIKWGILYYVAKDTVGTPTVCTDSDLQDPRVHCYMIRTERGGSPASQILSDKRVRIENGRFFIIGEQVSTDPRKARSAKATIVLSLGIENTAWVSPEMAKSTRMNIETTVSEKVYKWEG